MFSRAARIRCASGASANGTAGCTTGAAVPSDSAVDEQGLAANVAEYYGIPLAAVHFYPVRILELQWLDWRMTRSDSPGSSSRPSGSLDVGP
jgi:hypothetical protein